MSGDDDIPNVYIEHGSHSVDREPVRLQVTFPCPSFLTGGRKGYLNFDLINDAFYAENDYRIQQSMMRMQESFDRFYICYGDDLPHGIELFVNGKENAKKAADFIRNVRVAMNNQKRMSVKIG